MTSTGLVIPCFNEAERLPAASIKQLLEHRELHLFLVDDGSSDRTRDVLTDLARRSPDRVQVILLPENRGKAEAVRQGLLSALGRFDIVGYADADFATPAEELVRIAGILATSDMDAVIGSRVLMLGSEIARSPVRHYLGRVFATGAALAVGRSVYDTQCGAKFFRVSDALRSALRRPFRSRWAFDVELLGRLWAADPESRIVEVPLRTWIDIRGSKLRPTAMVRAGLELFLIARDLRRSQH